MFQTSASSSSAASNGTQQSQVVPELGHTELPSEEAAFPAVTNPSPMGGKGFDFFFNPSPFSSGKFDLPADYNGPSGLMTPNTSLLMSLLQSTPQQPANSSVSPFALAATASHGGQVMLKGDPMPSPSVSSSSSSHSLPASSLAASASASAPAAAAAAAAPVRGMIPSQSHQQLLQHYTAIQPSHSSTSAYLQPAPSNAIAAPSVSCLTPTPIAAATIAAAAAAAAVAAGVQPQTRQQLHRQLLHKPDTSSEADMLEMEEEEESHDGGDDDEEEMGDEEHGSDSEASFSPRQQQQQQQARKGRKRKATQPVTSSARTFDELTDDQIAFMDFKELMRLMLAAGLTRQDIAETKARRRRLKNRQSARLCSNKKRELCNELSTKNHQLHDTIERMQREIERLKKENALLKQQMR